MMNPLSPCGRGAGERGLAPVSAHETLRPVKESDLN
jgi:hypothetical protein